jgi:hypothetical protein
MILFPEMHGKQEKRNAVMTLREHEDELFVRWRAHRPDLVRDGIVDEAFFSPSRPRILFVLKEPNDPGGGGWDLRDVVKEGGRSQTWDNIARWVAGIERLPAETPWRDVARLTADHRKFLLRTIAAMNLKKSPGGGSTERDSLICVAREDRDLLLEQFNIYEPDLVICCGASVGDLMEELIIDASHGAWKPTSRGVWFKEFRQGRFIIDYAHPQVRTWSHLLFYGLVDAVREIRHPAG